MKALEHDPRRGAVTDVTARTRMRSAGRRRAAPAYAITSFPDGFRSATRRDGSGFALGRKPMAKRMRTSRDDETVLAESSR
jgi:hypothetical protein